MSEVAVLLKVWMEESKKQEERRQEDRKLYEEEQRKAEERRAEERTRYEEDGKLMKGTQRSYEGEMKKSDEENWRGRKSGKKTERGTRT